MRPHSGTRHLPSEAFRTENKSHKAGRHKTNRGLKRVATSGGGRVAKATVGAPAAAAAKAARIRRLSKSEQRSRLKMMRRAQLAKALGRRPEQLTAAVASAVKTVKRGGGGPPALVTFVCAEPDIPLRLLQAMLRQATAGGGSGEFQFRYARPTAADSPDALVACLDLAKVSDALVLVFQAGTEFPPAFRRVLSALYAQGVPGQLHATVLTAAESQRDRKAWERALLADLAAQGFGLPADSGLQAVRDSADLAALLRRVASRRRARATSAKRATLATGCPGFARARCYGLAEKVSVSAPAPDAPVQHQLVTRLRGPGPVGLNTGDLVHLVGWGDFRLTGWTVLADSDVGAADVDDDGEDDAVAMETAVAADDDNNNSAEAATPAQLQFPDEVDTPKDVPARERFARYRLLGTSAAVTSHRDAAWDPWADLPADYAGLAQFANFLHARNRAVRLARGGPYALTVGDCQRVRLTLVAADAAAAAASPRPRGVLVWYRLLEHEDRLTLVNCLTRLSHDAPAALKSGRPGVQLLWQVGWRRFYAAPVFSEPDASAGAHTPRLCLRHLAPGQHAGASFYAPLTFTPAPVLALTASGRPLLCGTLESCDPGRVILKRCVLSGQPFKIHKRSAVVRYLFFNPGDATHYRDANLRTKHGRRGKILEPVGTHGLCKCRFDGPVTNMDTVLLDLYKRQFPKLTYRPVAMGTAE